MTQQTDARPLDETDMLEAVRVCRETLGPLAEQDWSRQAGTLEWDCRRTLDHIADGLAIYCGLIGARAQGRIPFIRNGAPALEPDGLVGVVVVAGEVLAAVMRDAPDDGRFFHFAGMGDLSGFAAMSCNEILVHTFDITQGLGVDFKGPGDISARVLARLFPWVKIDHDPWELHCWATNRISIPGRDAAGSDWQVQCAPLSEWDGTVRRRTPPPAAR